MLASETVETRVLESVCVMVATMAHDLVDLSEWTSEEMWVDSKVDMMVDRLASTEDP